MSEYIDFEIARKYLHKACEGLGSNGGLMLKIKFDEEPKADVQEVVHGEWLSDEDGNIHCSVCGRNGVGELFCEHCGAKMDGGR